MGDDKWQETTNHGEQLRHDMGMGNTMTIWSQVCSGKGRGLGWSYPSNTIPLLRFYEYTYITQYIYSLKSQTDLLKTCVSRLTIEVVCLSPHGKLIWAPSRFINPSVVDVNTTTASSILASWGCPISLRLMKKNSIKIWLDHLKVSRILLFFFHPPDVHKVFNKVIVFFTPIIHINILYFQHSQIRCQGSQVWHQAYYQERCQCNYSASQTCQTCTIKCLNSSHQ